MNLSYIQGETITYSLPDAGFAAAVLHYGSYRVALTKTNDEWRATIDTSALSGIYRYAVIADGSVREQGQFAVKPLVSKYRAIIDAIDTALQSVATNGKYSVSVGEISLTDKTFDEMVKAKNYYQRLATADENGTTPSFGPQRVSEVYA